MLSCSISDLLNAFAAPPVLLSVWSALGVFGKSWKVCYEKHDENLKDIFLFALETTPESGLGQLSQLFEVGKAPSLTSRGAYRDSPYGGRLPD